MPKKQKSLLKKTTATAKRVHKLTRRTSKHAIRKLTKKRTLKSTVGRLLRTGVILIATISTGSLAYAIATTKPVINVAVTGSAGPRQLGTAATPTPTPRPAGAPDLTGRASWYAYGLPEPDALTCASRTFGRGTYLRVKDLNNGRTMTCLVNDYGPEIWTGRIIDLSRGSFLQLDSLSAGVIPVEIFVASGQSGQSGQSGPKAPISVDLGLTVGYDWCHLSHNGQFCDAHRQDGRYEK
jgi:rare lipoprotein A (peptidoglycan hydrolase)